MNPESEVREQSLEEIQLKAEEGDANAQISLGELYFTGRKSLQRDLSAALKWYWLAARQGNAHGQWMLGGLYRHHRRNEAKAQEWYRIAAENYRKEAERGDAHAQERLGFYYAQGLGGEQDDAKALHWSRLAAEKGDCFSQSLLGDYYAQGRGVTKDEAQALRWYLRAADGGYSHGLLYLKVGEFYWEGRGTPKDSVKAREWLRRAAERGIRNKVTDQVESLLGPLFPEKVTHI